MEEIIRKYLVLDDVYPPRVAQRVLIGTYTPIYTGMDT
jgi:hypothetical protein